MMRVCAVAAAVAWSSPAFGQSSAASFKALLEHVGATCKAQGPAVECTITRKAPDGSGQDISAAYSTLGQSIHTIIVRVTPFGHHKQPDSAKLYGAVSSFLGDDLKDYPALVDFADACVKQKQVRRCNIMMAAGRVQVQVTTNTTGPLSHLSAVLVWQER